MELIIRSTVLENNVSFFFALVREKDSRITALNNVSLKYID